MDLKSDKRQHIQLELDFSFPRSGEACGTGREEIESPLAAHDTESPASTDRWMEEVCERDNLTGIARLSVESSGSQITPIYDAFLRCARFDLQGIRASSSLRRRGSCLCPLMRRNCFSATNRPDPTQRSR